MTTPTTQTRLERGALTGHIMSDAEKRAHDRILSLADFHDRRVIPAPVSLAGPGCKVIRFDPLREGVPGAEIITLYAPTDPTPPTGAPAMARAA